MSLYLFLGDRKVPVNGELETGNQQNTWPTGSFSGRMVLVKKIHLDAEDLGTDFHKTACAHFEDHLDRSSK